mgnify:CR=1 FL=1
MKAFNLETIQKLWGSGKPVPYKNKLYSVRKMSYGQYFLEPIGWQGGEKAGFAKDTYWLSRIPNGQGLLSIERSENL